MKPRMLSVLLSVVTILASCAAPAPVPESSAPSCGAGADIRVKLLRERGSTPLAVAQHPVWSLDYRVLHINHSQQWEKIRGRAPEPVSETGDFGIGVFSAHDTTDWYIGVDVIDDKIVSNSGDREYLYSGDVFELFLAADGLSFLEDFHELVRRNTDPRRAFFQIQVPPMALGNPTWYFSSYRTDPALREAVTDSRFAVRTELTPTGWRALMKISFDLIDRIVVGGDKHVKVGMDLLDYDDAIAEKDEPFKPQNVASPDRDERNVNCPACMRRIIFET